MFDIYTRHKQIRRLWIVCSYTYINNSEVSFLYSNMAGGVCKLLFVLVLRRVWTTALIIRSSKLDVYHLRQIFDKEYMDIKREHNTNKQKLLNKNFKKKIMQMGYFFVLGGGKKYCN